MTIYLATKGVYSSYQVEAAFSSRAKAKAYMAKFPDDSYGGWNSIEEYELDPCDAMVASNSNPYAVIMEYDGGATVRPAYDTSPLELVRAYDRRDRISGVVWADSEQHALKIVNEFRAQKIASGEMKSHDEIVAEEKEKLAKRRDKARSSK